MSKKTPNELISNSDKKINRIIREIRMKLGLTQAEVAERLNMITTTYSQMEREGNVPANKIIPLAAIFQVDPMVLLGATNSNGLKQDGPEIPIPEPMNLLLSNREKNNIEMLRRLRPEDREEVFKFIKKLHDDKFKKGN